MSKELKKLKNDLYRQSVLQKQGAWKEKNFKKAFKIRQQEKINYEKWRLLNGIIKEMEKEENENK